MTSLERRLRAFARALGLTVSVRRLDLGRYQYRADDVLRIEPTDKIQERCSNIAHEIGHWLVATPKQRRLPEYGCGTSPECTRDTAAVVRNPTLTEERASAAGIFVELACGGDGLYTFAFHNWAFVPGRELAVIARAAEIPRVIDQIRAWRPS